MKSQTLGGDYTHNVFIHMKALVKTRRAMPELVLSLSPSVTEFQCAHPRLYADVFGSEPPVPCKWSVVELEAIARCVPMRGRRAAHAADAAPAPGLAACIPAVHG